MPRIGIISDTHNLLRPEACQLLAGSELIIHAGDIGSKEILDQLSQIAPVTAVRGNVDIDPWTESLPNTHVMEVGGRHIYIIHNINLMNLDPAAAGYDVVIFGHTHIPHNEVIDGVLHLNPGSAGAKRFDHPIALAILELDEHIIHAEIHSIAI